MSTEQCIVASTAARDNNLRALLARIKSAHREWGAFDRSIDVKIARLRRKIEADPSKPKIIRTVRTIGYVLKTNPT